MASQKSAHAYTKIKQLTSLGAKRIRVVAPKPFRSMSEAFDVVSHFARHGPLIDYRFLRVSTPLLGLVSSSGDPGENLVSFSPSPLSLPFSLPCSLSFLTTAAHTFSSVQIPVGTPILFTSPTLPKSTWIH